MRFLFIGCITLFGSLQAKDFSTAKEPVNSESIVHAENGLGLFASGDFLYWKAAENGLEYVQSGNVNKVSTIGDVEKVTPKWDPGFRVGIGYHTSYDGWSVSCMGTRYCTHTSNAVGDYLAPALLPLWGHYDHDSGDQVRYAAASWRLSLTTIDGLVGKSFAVSKYFSLKPSFGCSYAYLSQKMDVYYFIGTSSAKGITYYNIDQNTYPETRLWGVGPTIGVNGDYKIWKGFSLFGDLLGSLFYSKFHADLEIFRNGVTIGISKDRFNETIGHISLIGGVSVNTYLYKEKIRFAIKLGYEENVWFGVNKMQHFLHKVRETKYYQENKSLFLQGITVHAQLDF